MFWHTSKLKKKKLSHHQYGARNASPAASYKCNSSRGLLGSDTVTWYSRIPRYRSSILPPSSGIYVHTKNTYTTNSHSCQNELHHSYEITRCNQKFPDWVITKCTLKKINTRWEVTQRVMAAKLTRLTHKIAIQLHLVADSYTISSSRSRRPVRKLLDTLSYAVCEHMNVHESLRNTLYMKDKISYSFFAGTIKIFP
jgi:hypothetical protein